MSGPPSWGLHPIRTARWAFEITGPPWSTGQLKIPVMSDALIASIATRHTIGIIVVNQSKFSFIGLILEGQRKQLRKTLRKKDLLRLQNLQLRSERLILLQLLHQKEGSNLLESKSLPLLLHFRVGEDSDSETESDIRMEQDPPVHNEENEPIRTAEHESVRIEEVEQIHNETLLRTEATSPTHEVTPQLNDYVPSPPRSPKSTTSIPITIAPMPPPVSSQPSTTIPILIPIFTESSISDHTSATPISSVNVSDTGANTSGFSTHVTPPISPILTDDSEMLFRDDKDDDLDLFAYSPFQIQIDGEDEVSTMKGELKYLHEKIDQLLLASQVSTSEAYSKTAVESILERVTKEQYANVSTLSKAFYDSIVVFKATTEKKNVNFVELRKAIQSDDETFQSSITAKITKL
uniref:Uncharacterized protein n=1 Tax=Lactuca sativa TaxID=4236 RepID=A0A9R1WT31_LACSA|nr:hypothetical protein LSAT_V11C900501550 [Lactuca sativa]